MAFTINTDGPYLLDTHLRQEFEMLLAAGVLTEPQALRCVETARGATFIASRWRGAAGAVDVRPSVRL